MTSTETTTQTFRAWIKATPEAIWQALTDEAWNGRYGYCVPSELDLRPGGAYRVNSTPPMVAMGMPEVLIDGEVIAAEAPGRLVQTWHALFGPETAAEPPTTLTYEIEAALHGVTRLTVTHDVTGAPLTAAIVSGSVTEAGGGWSWILSDLKTLLETGSALPPQMGG